MHAYVYMYVYVYIFLIICFDMYGPEWLSGIISCMFEVCAFGIRIKESRTMILLVLEATAVQEARKPLIRLGTR